VAADLPIVLAPWAAHSPATPGHAANGMKSSKFDE
jgi:hypothetical protein